jgi:hypothetical protein
MPMTSVTTASSATACHNKRLKAAVDRLTCEKVAAAQTVPRGVEGSGAHSLLSARPWSDSDHCCAIFWVSSDKSAWSRSPKKNVAPSDVRWNLFPL